MKIKITKQGLTRLIQLFTLLFMVLGLNVIQGQPYTIGGIDYNPCGPSETITASFSNTAGALTTGVYRDKVLLTVSGTGQSLGTAFNDAFYLTASQSYNANYYKLVTTIDALVQWNPDDEAYRHLVYDVDAGVETTPPYAPAYQANNTYTFVIDMATLNPSAGPGVYTNLRIGVSDGQFNDNSGQYVATITQLCCPDEDGDGTDDCYDNCISIANTDQSDVDGDGIGDACDVCPDNADHSDGDGDGFPDCANCGNNKILVCHVPPGNPCNEQQLCISENASSAHIDGGKGHGNCYVGACLELNCDTGLSPNKEVLLDLSSIPPSKIMDPKETPDPDFEYNKLLFLESIVFPNPARDYVNVNIGEYSTSINLTIYNSQGSKLIQQSLRAGQAIVRIDISNEKFVPGMYMIRLHNDYIDKTERLLITK